jgi:putative glutamine amidotransferase
MSRKPRIGLCADTKLLDPHLFQCVGDKYIRAVADGAGGLPLLIPSTPGTVDFDALLATVDGIVLPGAYANVHPEHYGQQPYEGCLLDTTRDALTLNLIKQVLDLGIPLLGLCRGFQEINVALGGSLHQRLSKVDGLDDHEENEDDPLEVQYGPAHRVDLEAGGLLNRISGLDAIEVNSVHGQGIDRLADGLRVEARAPDGLVEAFAVEDARAFALAVQWHPEWRFAEHPLYAAIWSAFGDACRGYADSTDASRSRHKDSK